MSSGAAVAIQTPSVNEEVSVEEKTEFDVILQEVPSDKRVSGILAIRKITPLGISEAKQFIDSLPKAICVGVSKEKAEEAKKILEDSGSVAIIK
jgi:large subunit ribosomal protein L7/L12